MPDSKIAPIRVSVRISELSEEDEPEILAADEEDSAWETDFVGEEQATRNVANAKIGRSRDMKEK